MNNQSSFIQTIQAWQKKSQSCQKPELYPGTKFQKQKDTFKKNVTGERTRRVAFDILLQVERGIKLSDALSSCLDLLKLEQRDRRFVRLLVTSVLRQRGQLERIISSLIKRRPFGSQANRCSSSGS